MHAGLRAPGRAPACPGGGTPAHRRSREGPPVDCDKHEYNQNAGNANIIIFRDDTWPYEGSGNTLALTTVTYNLDTGEIYDADMELNSADNHFTARRHQRRLRPALHRHPRDGPLPRPRPLARPRRHHVPELQPSAPPTCATSRADDIAGICAIYPPGGAIGDLRPHAAARLLRECGATGRPAATSRTVRPRLGTPAASRRAARRRLPRAAAAPRLAAARAAPGLRVAARSAPSSSGRGAAPPARRLGAVTRARRPHVALVETAAELAQVAGGAPRRADRLAVDVEANGLHAYRACALHAPARLARGRRGRGRRRRHARRVRSRRSRALLGPEGPVKVLHDLTFDARLLAEAGAPLGRVRDTSVAARLLGFAATGLAALLASELGRRPSTSTSSSTTGRAARSRPPSSTTSPATCATCSPSTSASSAARRGARHRPPRSPTSAPTSSRTALAPPRDARPGVRRASRAPPRSTRWAAPCCAASARPATRPPRAADVPPFKVIGQRRRSSTSPAAARSTGRARRRARRHGGRAPGGRPRRWLARHRRRPRATATCPPRTSALFAPAVRRPRVVRAAPRPRDAGHRLAQGARRRGAASTSRPCSPATAPTDLVDALLDHDDRPDRDAAARGAIARIPGLGARRHRALRCGALAGARRGAPPPAPARVRRAGRDLTRRARRRRRALGRSHRRARRPRARAPRASRCVGVGGAGLPRRGRRRPSPTRRPSSRWASPTSRARCPRSAAALARLARARPAARPRARRCSSTSPS